MLDRESYIFATFFALRVVPTALHEKMQGDSVGHKRDQQGLAPFRLSRHRSWFYPFRAFRRVIIIACATLNLHLRTPPLSAVPDAAVATV